MSDILHIVSVSSLSTLLSSPSLFSKKAMCSSLLQPLLVGVFRVFFWWSFSPYPTESKQQKNTQSKERAWKNTRQ
jgi:hypothetical protein